MALPITKTITLPLSFVSGDTCKVPISILFPVSRLVLRTASIYQVVNATDATSILCIRSDLIDNDILFHFAPSAEYINLPLNQNFYLTNKNINTTFTFQVLLGQTMPLNVPADIEIGIFLTLEMYA